LPCPSSFEGATVREQLKRTLEELTQQGIIAPVIIVPTSQVIIVPTTSNPGSR